jgi:hypothetical protein
LLQILPNDTILWFKWWRQKYIVYSPICFSQLFAQQMLPFPETSFSKELMCGRVQMTHHCSNIFKFMGFISFN